MSHRFSIDRRSTLIGGTALIFTGCDEDSGKSRNYTPTNQTFGGEVLQELAFYLTMGAIAATGGSLVAGIIGLSRLSRTLRRLGAFANRADKIVGAINTLNNVRSNLPAQMTPNPGYTPKNIIVNGFSNVPIVGPKVDLDLGIVSDGDADFGNYKIQTCVLPVELGQPRTLAQALRNGDFPQAVTRPSLNNRYWSQSLPVRLPYAGAYAYYCWKVPIGGQLTDYMVANEAYIGPSFVAMDQSDVRSISDEIATGRSVQASYRLRA
ncbi:MAG: hypothetical protein AAGL10_08940 [Pseudomonadota bacterium]